MSVRPSQAPAPFSPKPVTVSTWPSHVHVSACSSPSADRVRVLPEASYVADASVVTWAPSGVVRVADMPVSVCGWVPSGAP
ncbi:hypothetical protein [Streptomyces sp. NPDC006997]|uniref:hypothetical protein n=1 Tax=Streptomyces sp. NPDC006997 TaxID=3155356 RepID=UPI0033E359F4